MLLYVQLQGTGYNFRIPTIGDFYDFQNEHIFTRSFQAPLVNMDDDDVREPLTMAAEDTVVEEDEDDDLEVVRDPLAEDSYEDEILNHLEDSDDDAESESSEDEMLDDDSETEVRALDKAQYGENTPKKGTRKRSKLPSGIWVHIKRIKDPAILGRKSKFDPTHVCVKCWCRMHFGWNTLASNWVTTKGTDHMRNFHEEEGTGAAACNRLFAKKVRLTNALLATYFITQLLIADHAL